MNQVKAGAVLNYVIIGLNTLLGLLYTPYMLRMLGQNEYGLYSLVASIIGYLTILDFGFGNAIVRYTAKFIAEGKKQEQWEMFGMFLCVYTIIGLIAFVIGLGLYFNVDRLFDQTMTADELSQARVMMMLLVINLALTFPFSMFGSIITAYEDFVFQKIVSILRLLLSTATIVLLLYIGYKAVAMVVVQTVFNISILLLNYIYCRYKIRIHIRFNRFNWAFIKEITTYSFWLFLNAIMDKIYWGTGQFVLGSISGTIAVSIFSVAILLQQMYMSFSVSISSVLLPRITAMVAHNKANHEVSDIFIRTGRLQCIVLALVLSGFIIFGQPFIDLWAGSGYGDSFVVTLIFFTALFVPMIQNTGITILQARNQLRFRSILYLVISIVSLIFQIVLAKRYGAIGCAWAIGGALIIGQGIIMNLYYAKYQAINISKFWREVGKMLIMPFVMTICSLTVLRYFAISDIKILFIGIPIFLIVYVPLFWQFSMNDYERQLLLSPIRKIIHI